MIARLFLWLRSVLLRQRLEGDMQEEMAQHIERSAQRLAARGLPMEEARQQARREFGNVPWLQEQGRIARGTNGLDTVLRDVRFAFRQFARNPLSALTIVGVLSVGIGINVVLFTIVHSVTDRPPSGVSQSDNLVRIRGSQLKDGSRVERPFSSDEVRGYAALTDHLSTVAAWTSQPVTAAAPGVDAFTLTATFVTDDYFELLGTRAVRGRLLVAGDAAQVAVLSHAAWERSFALDPAIIGRTITVADVPFTIVGVAPPRFRGAAWDARDDMQLWLPLTSHAQVFPGVAQDAALFFAIGRLRPGASRATAGAAALVVAGRNTSAQRDTSSDAAAQLTRDPSVEVAPLLADNLEPGAESQLRFASLAFGVLGLLTLLVTCANVGSLQTGLALARRREIAIRMSLGAERRRVIRQLVTESLVLALLAAGGAVAVTWGILRILLGIVGAFSFELSFDQPAIAVAFVLALVAGLLFGVSPALHATRVGVTGALRDSARTIGGGRARLQRGLVVAQIAFTQPLAVCLATTVLMSIAQFRDNPRNPNGERIVQLRLSSTGAQRSAEPGTNANQLELERERLETERLVDRFGQTKGVMQAAFVPSRAPLSLEAFTLPNATARPGREPAALFLAGRSSMPGYLDLIGTPIVLGRDLGIADTATLGANTIPVVIGDDMARALWGSASPIGTRITRAAAASSVSLEVVGVYRNPVASKGHARSPFAVYVPPDPRLQAQASSRLFMLRLTGSPESTVPAIRAVVRAEAPHSAITELRTLASLEEQERFLLWGAIGLFSGAGLVVLVLCALGLYAVVAFAVEQRTSEIAVRVAIGARARQIVRHFASDGLRLTAIGIVIGLPASMLGLRQLLSLSPEVPDVSLSIVMSVVAVCVGGVASLASWIPASRASQVDPATVLRRE